MIYVEDFEPVLICTACNREPAVWKLSAPPICGDCGRKVTDEEWRRWLDAHDAWEVATGQRDSNDVRQPA